MRSILVSLVAAAALLAPVEASNPVPFQGVLIDPTGQPVVVPVTLHFRVFQGGDATSLPSIGTLVYHESVTLVPSDGAFRHMVGTGMPATDCAAGPCVLDASTFGTSGAPTWIEVALAGEVLLPRTLVTTAPYAQRALSVEEAEGGSLTGTVTADVLRARAGTVGDGLSSAVELFLQSSSGSTTVTWDPARSEVVFGARTRHPSGLSIDPDRPLRFDTAESLTTDASSSSLSLGAGFASTTLAPAVRFDAAVELRSRVTFRDDVVFTTEKGFGQFAASTFPGGQSNGAPGTGVELRNFLHEPFDAACDAPGSVPGSDTELIWAGPYYNAQPGNLLSRENPDDYSLGFLFTAGWTHVSGDRRAEYIFRHITKDGSTTWHPFYWNIVGVATNTPLLDYTIRTSPTQVALRVNPTAVAFGGAPTGNGDLEVPAGGGTLYLAGAPGGRVTFEGRTSDAHQSEVTARNPTADREIELPNAAGRVHLNAINPHAGTVMFGDSDDTADTGQEVCQSVSLSCQDVRTMNGQDSDCVTDQGEPTVLHFVFCRQ